MPIHHTDQFLSDCRRRFESELAQARERARTAGDDMVPDDIEARLQRAQELMRQMNGLLSAAALDAWRRRYDQAADAIQSSLRVAARQH